MKHAGTVMFIVIAISDQFGGRTEPSMFFMPELKKFQD
jgi:hypothetical protein